MNYEMEELLPIAGRLAKRYTGTDSTSISYEKAEQLMEAVLYCIREAELETPCAAAAKGTPAGQLYEAGRTAVERKVKKSLELYHRLLPEFSDYGNPYLSDTVLKGLPEFFQWYDTEFAPQNTILVLDYPVLRDLSSYTGVDRIYEYLLCVSMEQKFLKAFPEGLAGKLIYSYCGDARGMADNLCESVLFAMAEYILAKKPLGTEELKAEDGLLIRQRLGKMELTEVKSYLRAALKKFVEAYCEDPEELFGYLVYAVDNIAVRLKNSTCNFSSSVVE